MATKKIKVLVKNESAAYSSETIQFGNKKYKIVAENGNAYSRLNIYIYTENNGLSLIACANDIPHYIAVNYVLHDKLRVQGNRLNINSAESYIMCIFDD